MEDILKIAIASGLKFKSGNNIVSTEYIPNNTFGVFVGVERSAKHKLNTWPHDIHGCIGYWDPNYNTMIKSNIVKKIREVAYSATWEDERRNYFKNSIYVDLLAKYKIYYMLEPIMEIDSSTGIIIANSELFNNKIYGLIVESSNSLNRATYLPDVFPDKPWTYIKESLIQKANIYDNNIKFYAYNCQIISMSIADYFFVPIQDFFNKNYNIFIPYSISSNDDIYIDEHENVRNLASIYDILQMQKYGYGISNKTFTAIKNNIEYYKHKYESNPQSMRQASAFLILCLYILNKNDKFVHTIKNYLLGELQFQNKYDEHAVSFKSSSGNLENIPNSTTVNFVPLDKNFELGEILMALNIVESNNPIVVRETNKIPLIDKDEQSDIDIFRYNWFSKSVSKINNKYYKYNLIKKVINYIDTYQNYNETNYYAVEFETLATLYSKITNSKTKLLIEKYIEKILIQIENRKNKYGLYQFKNGETRIDITGHIMNGLFSLLLLLI
ncbi:AMMECR1 domain protein [Tupanvirus soda lake]|uniref:AMMECR1 domain protein n=2 Tax=Tupanvirus TaxID=2094720 RepID=A0A6N1NHS7_9VIRU|nr:AMMECR1 domain protein [Tupanvirus soda lake]QKU34664.1 AMMECR1 domain protein [Tupanvirus soda lake]